MNTKIRGMAASLHLCCVVWYLIGRYFKLGFVTGIHPGAEPDGAVLSVKWPVLVVGGTLCFRFYPFDARHRPVHG